MLPRLILMLASMSCAGMVLAGNGDPAVLAARKDLASRLAVPVERVAVESINIGDEADPTGGCVRIGAPVAESMDKGTGLVLIVAGQKHYYYASEGQEYHYCELPSTKKRGPVRPPDS